MQIFDVHVRCDTRDDDDLRNLRYFETTHVLATAHPATGFALAHDLIEFWERLAVQEMSRLRSFDLEPFLALGVRPDGRPRRTHHEIWSALEEFLSRKDVVAIGEVGALEDSRPHWELFDRQVKLAERHDLALLVTPPPKLLVNMTYKMMRRLESLGFPPERAIMNHLDVRLIETVAAEGFVAGVSVSPYHLEPREAASHLAQVIQSLGSDRRIVLNSSLRSGAADILGLPKTIVSLQDVGVSRESIHAIAFQNASQVLLEAP